MKKIELLAPAGDLERLKINLLYGADAVYLGGEKYSLRANATNFTLDELKEGCTFAHSLGKRVHQTINIVFHNEDMEDVKEYIGKCVKAGVDAFIVSDPFIINYIKEEYPKVEVHLSTQSSMTNNMAVKFFEEEGVNRVVLARELSKDEIKEIIDSTNVDIEVFLQGAMCSLFSGRCALSSYVTNRDANRGGCAQICRFAFKTNSEDFTFASKDLSLAKRIKDLIEIGVTSLKIEGRMRSIYYLATVIGSYRKLIDAYYYGTLTDELIKREAKILDRVANRDTSEQFFKGYNDYNDEYFTGRCEISNQDFLGLVVASDGKYLTIHEKNYFKKGDVAEVFTPSGEVYDYVISDIITKDGIVDTARHPEEELKLPFNIKVPKYSMIRKKVNYD